MKKTTLVSLLLLLAFPMAGWGMYRFNDVYGPSGIGAQWMALTGNGDSGGSSAVTPMNTAANFVDARNSVLLMNGGVSSEDLLAVFLVLPDIRGTFSVGFNWLPTAPYSSTQDVLVDNGSYQVVKTPLGVGPNALYQFDFTKTQNTSSYSSVRGNLIFHQNPSGRPSQTLQVPFIVANVYNGTAEGNPLLFKATIRESGTTVNTGDIMAHDRFSWKVTEDLTVGSNSDWVFVPISQLPIDSNTVNYRLTTDITNYTGTRYAMQRYDGYSWAPLFPIRWAFDIPSVADVPANIPLDELSHIPPGLVTTYNQSFNVVSGVKEAMHVYPVNPASGFRNLTLSHRSVFGLDLGTGKSAASPYSFSATGFKLLSAGMDFMSKVGSALNISSPQMPEPSDGVMSGSVNFAYVAGDVVNSFAVNAPLPGRIAPSGLLPLHITFNLPRSNQLVGPKWDALLKQWRETGDIRNLFASSFSVYLQDAFGKNLDLLKWLRDQDSYAKCVKVFLDEQRSVITVSLIVMLADGSTSRVRVVEDKSVTTDHAFIAIMDGNANNRWDMTFFTAPAGYVPTDRKDSDGGSSGCNASEWGALLLLCVLPVRNLIKRR